MAAIGWYRFDAGLLPRGIVIVEAMRQSASLWEGPVASLFETLAESLPANLQPEIAFLGDSRTFPLQAVQQNTITLARELGRYPVLGPLLHALQRDALGDVPLLVITTRPVVDIDDWNVPEVTRRTLVYRLFGEARVSPDGFREVDNTTDFSQFVEHLSDPIEHVRITQDQGLAVNWSGSGYLRQGPGLEAGGLADYATTVQFVSSGSAPATAQVRRRSGVERRVPLRTAAPLPESEAVPLRGSEGSVLSFWRRGMTYYCPGCRWSHPPGHVRCRDAGGAPLFPTLESRPIGTVVVVENQGGAAERFREVPRRRLLLEDGRVLDWSEDVPKFQVYRGDQWHDEAAAGRFLSIGENRHALRL